MSDITKIKRTENEHTGDVANKIAELGKDNIKLVEQFGASLISSLNDVPDFDAFKNGLIYSHRDFDKFFEKLKSGEKSAIVSGFNASGTPHIAQAFAFDVNLLFQKKYGVNMFIPISDDESYVTLKVDTREEAVKNSLRLARSVIALGFDTNKTKVIIDYFYTNIYNMAFKLSRGINLSEIKAVYGYRHSDNIGLQFYPTVQAAHILLPQTRDIRNVLVPIGPDEDAHLRVCRGLSEKFGFNKPAVIHWRFLPGLDGNKMSKSRGNAIFLTDSDSEIRKKIMSAYSGGRQTIEEHRKYGGNPDIDIAYLYLKAYFLGGKGTVELADEYRKGRVLSGELKMMLFKKVINNVREFKERYNKVTDKDLQRIIMTNEEVDLASEMQKYGVLEEEI